MKEITTCRFINKVNKQKTEEMTLCAEWFDAECKIFILGSKEPLEGKLTTSELKIFANNYSKSVDVYIQETKDIFAGKDSEVEFILEENNFKWRKKIWICGNIGIKSLFNIEPLSNLLKLVLDKYGSLKNTAMKIEEDNSQLKSHLNTLKSSSEEMINMKNCLESELYKKFLIILNNKKKKIRELENRLKKEVNYQNSVYDVQTDDSEDPDVKVDKKKVTMTKKKSIKRKFDKSSNNNETELKTIKTFKEKNKCESNSSDNTDVLIASVSYVKTIDDVDSVNKISTYLSTNSIDQSKKNENDTCNTDKSLMSLEESEDEIQLKLTDESTESIGTCAVVNKMNSIEAESDEDLFSNSSE